MKQIILSERRLRQIIREAAKSQLDDDMWVEIEGDSRSATIIIRKTGLPRVHGPGMIRLERIKLRDGEIWAVINSAASPGWGPLLYDLVMELVVDRYGALGLASDRLQVSPAAEKIWQYYYTQRNDVSRDELPAGYHDDLERIPEPRRYSYHKTGSSLLTSLQRSNQLKMELDI